ncbi:MAG: ATP-dependent DNA helicase [Fretibacterium sp.]|nr:ATP-dependent DNA helicase [Fretibacterium sp.]
MNYITSFLPLKDFYAPSGPLSSLPGYEFRPQQLEVAQTVENFLRGPGAALAVEAPTGVGKTFAVLVPALREARQLGTRLLFLTAGITLQEQLIGKDLPRLRQLLGFDFTFGLLKGRSNYICLRLARNAAEPSLFEAEGGEGELVPLARWLEETETGDLAERGNAASLQALSAGAQNCIGPACPCRDRCFVIRAYRRAQDWDLVVANYHLFFSHILEGTGNFPVRYNWLICDEAHRLPDAARSSAAVRAGADNVLSLMGARNLQGFAPFLPESVRDTLPPLAGKAREELQKLFSSLADSLPSGGLQAPDEGLLQRGRSAVALLDDLLRSLRPFEDRFMMGDISDRRDLARGAEMMNWIDSVREFKHSLLWCLSVEQFPKWAYWAETSLTGRGSLAGRPHAALMSKPVDAAEIIQEVLKKEAPDKAVFTSATLTLTGGGHGSSPSASFDFWSRESGIMPDESLVVSSPFDYRQQMEVLVVDAGLGVMEKGYDERMCRVMEKLCDDNGGRTLVLLSSLRLLNAFARKMKGKERPYAILVQGDLPQRQLLRRFAEDETSILIGSVSFREGVDVPGEGLTQVIIDRIPFPHPSDPLVRARDVLEGGKGFVRVTLPTARMFLRQAVGRLIRSSSDHGRVVLLDGRAVEKKNWGILSAFPPCRVRRLTVREGRE